MKKILYLVFISLSGFIQLYAQDESNKRLISYELVATHTKEDLIAKFKKEKLPKAIVPVNNGVDVYEVLYKTVWHDGAFIQASGLYFVPKLDRKQSLPTVVYHHGTQIKKKRRVRLGGEQAICIGLAIDGYLVVRPDYIGLGKGEKKHLYHHVQTEAMASIDFLRAVKEINKDLKVKQNEFLFSTGYSQGGHAAMAFHKVVQEQHSDEFKITASAPMSGAYDMGGVQESVMFKEYSHPGYLPYLIFSFQEVYNFFDSPREFIKEPYDTILPPMFTGLHSMGDINRVIPKIPKDIVQDVIVEAYLNDENFPFKKALKENSVHDWKPTSPVLFCYCEADEQVSYLNSIEAHKRMKANGAKNIRKLSIEKSFSHNECAPFAAMQVKMYFDSFIKGSKKGRLGPWFKRMLLGIGKRYVVKKNKRKQRAEKKKQQAKD